MQPTLETALNNGLTRLFHAIGFKKCSRCTVAARVAQAGLILSWPLQCVSVVKSARIRWESAAHPDRPGFTRIQFIRD